MRWTREEWEPRQSLHFSHSLADYLPSWTHVACTIPSVHTPPSHGDTSWVPACKLLPWWECRINHYNYMQGPPLHWPRTFLVPRTALYLSYMSRFDQPIRYTGVMLELHVSLHILSLFHLAKFLLAREKMDGGGSDSIVHFLPHRWRGSLSCTWPSSRRPS